MPAGPFTMGTSTDAWALDNERPAHQVDVRVVPHRHGAGLQRRLPRVRRGRRLRRRAAVERRPAGAGAASPASAPPRSGSARAAPGCAAGSPASSRCPTTSRCSTSAGSRPTPTPAGPAGGCPPRPSGRRPRPGTPETRTKRRFPWGDEAPTEEHANLGQTRYHPAAAGSFPAGASPSGALQMVGDVWEWTSTEFTGYPGFRSFPYKEYSEVFFDDGYKVLRGGCWATDPLACRTTFRNWDHPIRRQIFSGFRTARRCVGTWPASARRAPCRVAGGRPAARALRAVLGAPPAAARHGQRRRLRRRLVRRPRRSPCATGGPSRSGPTRRSRRWRRRSRRPARWPRSAPRPPARRRRGGRGTVHPRPLAVQPQRPAARLGHRPQGARRRRRPTCPTPGSASTPRCCSGWRWPAGRPAPRCPTAWPAPPATCSTTAAAG